MFKKLGWFVFFIYKYSENCVGDDRVYFNYNIV